MAHDSQHLHALVDMGSNGIRFSISTLKPPTARIMPTLYQHRAAISLYDAQHSAKGERQPIGDRVIAQVISSFKAFQSTCQDFGVSEKNIRVLATEATRTAINSVEFRARIKDDVGWDVTMLPKEEEGRVGAMGIKSSLPDVSGLVMDLGGGSTQLSWLNSTETADNSMPPSGAVSMPYGAAAMTMRLAEAEKAGTVKSLESEVRKAIREAYQSLQLPDEMKERGKREGGLTLYLSGGGFRGWGYILMSKHKVQPYPISTINGFKAGREDFVGVQEVKIAAAEALQDADEGIFRVSNRRAGQVPAVAFLVNVLAAELPHIKEVRFCQGGVREGYLYSSLEPDVQARHPLVVATLPFAPPSAQSITELLADALPARSSGSDNDDHKAVFGAELLEAFSNLMYHHSSHSKDVQASAALRSTTSGVLSDVHGLLHETRALLALMLCARWSKDVPPIDQPFQRSLESLVDSPWALWWLKYIGAVAALVAAVYPAGVVPSGAPRLSLDARWEEGKKADQALHLTVRLNSASGEGAFADEIERIFKSGKKKNWIGGKSGTGHRIEVRVESP